MDGIPSLNDGKFKFGLFPHKYLSFLWIDQSLECFYPQLAFWVKNGDDLCSSDVYNIFIIFYYIKFVVKFWKFRPNIVYYIMTN